MEEPHSDSTAQERVELLVRHRLPPIGIVDDDLAFEGPELGPFVAGLRCTDDIKSSTALMSSGSLFLASATLTFMVPIIAISYGYVRKTEDKES